MPPLPPKKMIDIIAATKTEKRLIARIAQRAAISLGNKGEELNIAMSLEACHGNGCPLRLAELLLADDCSFCHDVFKIHDLIDHYTGRLEGGFIPRFAKPKNTVKINGK